MTTQLSHNSGVKTTAVFAVRVAPTATDWMPVERHINSNLLQIMQSKFDGRLAQYWEPPSGSEEHGVFIYYSQPVDALHYCKAYFVKVAETSASVLKNITQLLRVE